MLEKLRIAHQKLFGVFLSTIKKKQYTPFKRSATETIYE